MSRIKVFRADEVEIKPFVPHIFNQNEAFLSTIELLEILRVGSSKQMIRKLAEDEGLAFDKEKIRFTKKIINMMMDKISNGK